MNKLFREFIFCHNGRINRVIHIIGFSLIGLGIFDRNLVYVIGGGIMQELGHVYQYLKTHKFSDSPVYCLKPQSVFAFPLFFIIVLYVILVK